MRAFESCPEGYYKYRRSASARTVQGRARLLTILAYGTMVHVVETVCIAETGDRRRNHRPEDIGAARHAKPSKRRSKKTGRCLIVHEATRTSGFGAELSASWCTERCFYHLEAPVERGSPDSTRPIPTASNGHIFRGRCALPTAQSTTILKRLTDHGQASFVQDCPISGEGIAEAEDCRLARQGRRTGSRKTSRSPT